MVTYIFTSNALSYIIMCNYARFNLSYVLKVPAANIYFFMLLLFRMDVHS